MALPIELYNSATREKQVLRPSNPDQVGIYHCGPTVYKRQHLGNIRRFLIADFLKRALILAGYNVIDVINITDVGHLTQDDLDRGEDKLSHEAAIQRTTPQTIADRETKQFFSDCEAVAIEPATQYPKATDHIEQIQKLITDLLADNFAYQTKSGIYFDTETFPNYGLLSGNTRAALEAGKRIAPHPDKRHPADFALWIFDETALQKWESRWGTGYPGWHIECSAMSLQYLKQPIDIHTGGQDNKFPHHENEIAQSEAATGQPFVNLWLHNAHLNLKDAKLSKSKGDTLSVDTLRDRDISPLAFRLFALSGHYRTPQQFTWDAMHASQELLNAISALIRRLKDESGLPPAALPTPKETLVNEFLRPLQADLNTPVALATFTTYITSTNKQLDQNKDTNFPLIWSNLLYMDQLIGVIKPLLAELTEATIPADVAKLVEQRIAARDQGDFSKADSLRQQINAAGYEVEDTSTGPRVYKVK